MVRNLLAALTLVSVAALPSIAEAQTMNVTQAPAVDAPQPVGFENDVYCFGYLGAPAESFSGWLVAAENSDEQSGFANNDIVYAEGTGLQAGDEYWIISPENFIQDPEDGRDLGRFYAYRGRARALCVKGSSAVMQVVFLCTDIGPGVMLKPFEPVPIPLSRSTYPLTACDETTGKTSGKIVYCRDDKPGIGFGDDILIDLGESAVNAGDFLTVYRYTVAREFDVSQAGELSAIEAKDLHRTQLGEAAVLNVADHWALARITSARFEIRLGDKVELK